MSRGEKLYIAMVGLPAMGKSTVAAKLKENLEKEDIRVKIFNNGDVRRRIMKENSSHAGFYDPDNAEGLAIREKIADINFAEAKAYLSEGGQIAILDATNASLPRREKLAERLNNHAILFIECVNDDPEILSLSIGRKAKGPDFAHMCEDDACKSFEERIDYYRRIYSPLRTEPNRIRVDTLNNRVLDENTDAHLPYYPRIRDLLVSDWVKNLFLIRHGETVFNSEDRIGGDSDLTEKGRKQAWALSRHFLGTPIPYIFTSSKKRTLQMAAPLHETRSNCRLFSFKEFDEIDAGKCENLTYQEVRDQMPEVWRERGKDKYEYVYPGGEGYATLKDRVNHGIKKALFLSGNSEYIVIVGHQAVNRMILSHFLFRRTEDVPYIYIPQDKYFHIISTQTKKLLELRKF